jgi:hypothetical protein
VSPSKASDWDKLAENNKLTPSDVEKITKRLDKMDADAKHGPWTRRTLELISDQPGVVSTILARQMGIERYEYKAMIYKLKRLSLTYSLEVGYAISPRGRAYLRLTAPKPR